ncbi:MAG: hypothetical protein HQK51_05340 [Oligoflexia bacterium]|nr:hypothetical protein [Oligoflexia bacterium]
MKFIRINKHNKFYFQLWFVAFSLVLFSEYVILPSYATEEPLRFKPAVAITDTKTAFSKDKTSEKESFHCLVVSGIKYDHTGAFSQEAFLKQKNPSIMGHKCLHFESWKQLYNYYERYIKAEKKPGKVFIHEMAHGAPGAVIRSDTGEFTTGKEIFKFLVDISSTHPVGFSGSSCYSGDLMKFKLIADQGLEELTKTAREQGKEVDNPYYNSLKNLCMVTASNINRSTLSNQLEDLKQISPGMNLLQYYEKFFFKGLSSAAHYQKIKYPSYLLKPTTESGLAVFNELYPILDKSNDDSVVIANSLCLSNKIGDKDFIYLTQDKFEHYLKLPYQFSGHQDYLNYLVKMLPASSSKDKQKMIDSILGNKFWDIESDISSVVRTNNNSAAIIMPEFSLATSQESPSSTSFGDWNRWNACKNFTFPQKVKTVESPQFEEEDEIQTESGVVQIYF